jgi:hypothetical protein
MDEAEEVPVLVKCPVSSARLRQLMANAPVRMGGWLRCNLCLDYTVFDDLRDVWKHQERQYACRCGHRFDKKSAQGMIPAGKILIWDEHEEKLQEVLV